MRHAVVILLAGLAGGCLQTTYRDAGSTDDPPTMFERRVSYRLAPLFWSTAPRCAMVVTVGSAPRGINEIVEQAVERHLAQRVARTIGARARREAEEKLALDIREAGDRRRLARRLDCEAIMEIRPQEIGDDYAVLWARRSIGLTLTLRQASDDALLWTATHTASRSDGGLPLSLFSLPISAARAAVVSADSELFASITDDAIRRMMRTLPDTRSAAALN